MNIFSKAYLYEIFSLKTICFAINYPTPVAAVPAP